MTHVYVQDRDGKPLMPTTRCGHVRLLLKQGKARVVERTPFTIQLNYDTKDIVQPLYLGIDPGRTNIGIAVLDEAGNTVLSAQLETRNKEIPKLMQNRAANRRKHRSYGRRKVRQRRAVASGTTKAGAFERVLPGCDKPIICHHIRNKEARFNNRIRPAGWLTPTARQLLQTHMNLIHKLQKILPISDVVIELNKFSFMAMDNPHIKKWQYQRGPLYGYDGVEAAVSEQQSNHCLFCKAPIQHYHHVVPRSKRGSDTLGNRVGLCEKHHALVHTDSTWATKLATKKAGANKKYDALSVLNQIIPHLMESVANEFPGHTHTVNGTDTKVFRDRYEIHKDHHYDAACIAGIILDKPIIIDERLYRFKQYRRHDRQACHHENMKRVYFQDNKPVCSNRHKTIEQKDDSLEQYRQTHSYLEVSTLTVKGHQPIYKNMGRVMPGALVVYENKLYTLKGISGSEPYRGARRPGYYVFENGAKVRYRKCTPIRFNTGLVCIK